MNNRPVHWHEGMFLRPQHLQVADRYWAESLHLSSKWNHAYNYGYYSLNLDEAAISDYKVRVKECQARTEEGTLVWPESIAPRDRADLESAFDRPGPVKVFLAVPRFDPEVPIAFDPGDPEDPIVRKPPEPPLRYSVMRRGEPDENIGRKGLNDQEVRFRNLNVRLLLGDEDRRGSEVLLVGQVDPPDKSSPPKWNEACTPPLLTCRALTKFNRNFVEAVCDRVQTRIMDFSRHGLRLGDRDPHVLRRALMLAALNRASCRLQATAFGKEAVHPLMVYVELCSLVGDLAIFCEGPPTSTVPPYDHNNLGGCFSAVKGLIEDILKRTLPEAPQGSGDSPLETHSGG